MKFRPASGVTLISIATIVAGVAGYIVTWIVARTVGAENYALFAVFWSALYLVVSSLSGVQQEITRATHPVLEGSAPRVSRARNFGIALSVIVFIAIVLTAPLWNASLSPTNGWALVWPLAVGTSSYVLVAALSGSLYGVAQWQSIALMVVVDALLRLLSLGVVLAFTTEIVVLAWAVAIPFAATILLVWPFIRRGVVGATTIDAGYRRLSWNVARTVTASASLGAIVGGFPLLLGLTSRGESRALLGALILCITLARAPLVVSILSLQSLLVIQFRDNRATFIPTFLRLNGLIFVIGALIAVPAWLFGPWLFEEFFGAEYRLEGPILALLVASSALVGALCVSAAALLALRRHAAYSAGFFVSALATIVAVFLPLELVERASVALIAGPLLGLALNVIAIGLGRRLDQHGGAL